MNCVEFFVLIYKVETKGRPGAKLSFISGIVNHPAALIDASLFHYWTVREKYCWENEYPILIFTFSCYNTFLQTLTMLIIM